MEKHTGQSVLMKTVDEIRSTEERHDQIIATAKENAEKVLRSAREKIADEKAKMGEELTVFKNKKLAEGKSTIERDVDSIIEKAKKEGESLKKKKLAKKELLSAGLSLLK